VVLSSGWTPGAYDLVRTLGMAGIKTSVASSQPNDMAFYSRYCNGRHVLPDFETAHYPAILAQLRDLSGRAPEKPVLFYTSDPELRFILHFREHLALWYRMCLPSEELLSLLFNKVMFYELASTLNFPIPPTIPVVRGRTLSALIDTVPLPCIVKPAYSEDWIWDTPAQQAYFGPYKFALRRFDSREALLEFCDALPARPAGFVIQSYIEGRDDAIVSFHGYFDEQSRCLGSFLGQKIRTYPPHTGGSAYIRTLHDPDLVDRSINYLQRLHYRGIVKIDYKWDAQSRSFKILEINPRYNLWELLGAFAGVNLAHIAYRHQRGEQFSPMHRYADNYRLLFFKQDLRAYWSGYRKERAWSFRAYLTSFLSAERTIYRIFDLRDPLPFWHSVLGFVKRNVRRLFGIAPTDVHPPRPAPVLGEADRGRTTVMPPRSDSDVAHRHAS
jgi:predicted ATP-grasp superfamily ATP-dependent carboligase